MSKDIHLTQLQYVEALHRFRDRIAAGAELQYDDDETPGNQSTECSWGLCCKDKSMWPKDAIMFDRGPSISPLYRKDNQKCPMDRRETAGQDGCFYTCRVFKARGPLPTRQEAIALYDEQIRKVSK